MIPNDETLKEILNLALDKRKFKGNRKSIIDNGIKAVKLAYEGIISDNKYVDTVVVTSLENTIWQAERGL